MINWPIIPMVYNDSFTYMEWLGKLSYIADNHETRINEAEKDIVDIKEDIAAQNERIGSLEGWRTNTVDPFITDTINTLTDYGTRIGAAEGEITGLKGRMDTAEDDIDALESNLVAETAARNNADIGLDQKINEVNSTAIQALDKANRISIALENEGTIRYFYVSGPYTPDASGYVEFDLPDTDWGTIDVRARIDDSGYEEKRYTITANDSSITFKDGAVVEFTDNTKTAINFKPAAGTIVRLDYVLYKAALDEPSQDEKDIEFYDAMDANGDGIIDASDATLVLSYYGAASAGLIPPEYTGQASWRYWANLKNTEAGSQLVNPDAFPDFNEDGGVDGSDATNLLGYYGWISSTDTSGMTGPEALRKYRTLRESE